MIFKKMMAIYFNNNKKKKKRKQLGNNDIEKLENLAKTKVEHNFWSYLKY